ncbi:hypothetical protein acdb102_17550 [Acidothermaceae bacterium B102]|nr:hypothetical protein acdb102_17550 [Acidothermaceae bacterium B102]
MPTRRPRHLITETEQVARALEDAARRGPEDRGNSAKLLFHLVEEGHRALLDEAAQRRKTQLAAIRRTRGALTGVYGAGYLEELRADWPE